MALENASMKGMMRDTSMPIVTNASKLFKQIYQASALFKRSKHQHFAKYFSLRREAACEPS